MNRIPAILSVLAILITDDMKGLQLGVVNIIKQNKASFVPIVNMNF